MVGAARAPAVDRLAPVHALGAGDGRWLGPHLVAPDQRARVVRAREENVSWPLHRLDVPSFACPCRCCTCTQEMARRTWSNRGSWT